MSAMRHTPRCRQLLRGVSHSSALQGQARFAAEDPDKSPTQQGIEEFIGSHIISKGFMAEPPNPGRAWGRGELEGKGYEDLRRIWFVLLKERNQLLSIELFYQMQEETLGEFPHATRFDRVATSMRRLKEVMSERHDVASKLAWREFLRRAGEQYYSFPPGPPLPKGYGIKQREINVFTKRRLIDTPTEYEETEDEAFLRLKDKFELVFNTEVEDVQEALTPEGEERFARAEFIRLRLRAASRNLIPVQRDLMAAWREEREMLKEKGPFVYRIKFDSQETIDSVVARAAAAEDEVMRFDLHTDVPTEAAFADEDHLYINSTTLPLDPVGSEAYEHILAREDYLQKAATRIAPVAPQPFTSKPRGVDPYTKYVFVLL